MQPDPTLANQLAVDFVRAAVKQVMLYPFKVWGFGEDIALRALQEYSDVTGEPETAAHVRDLVRPWCKSVGALRYADHVAPGVAILELFRQTGEPVYSSAANRLGELYRSFKEVDGIAVHRQDLEGLNSLIWVDCLALDGPFLAQLARHSDDDSWLELGVRTVRAYTRVLFDEDAGLFRHGYNVHTKRCSDCNWGRGNGWAMHGLVDFLDELPSEHPARRELMSLLCRQVDAVTCSQAENGLWHTILDDLDSPLENSTAAFFASAVLKARRLGLLDGLNQSDLDNMLDCAIAALHSATTRDGGLPVSYATPVGSRDTYLDAPLGVFPWGQGPLILTFTEAERAARRTPRTEEQAAGSGGKRT